MEQHNIEYKRIWKEDFLKNVCAFANTEGGTIYLGIDDIGMVTGIENPEYLLENLPNIIKNKTGIIPSVYLIERDSRNVICIKVLVSSVPVSYMGRYFVRSGTAVLELKDRELSDFLLKKSGLTWDALETGDNILLEPDEETINRFKILSSERLPYLGDVQAEILFKKLNLISVSGKIKNAAILLFDKNPQRYFPQATIKIGLFIDEATLVSSDIISGNLIKQAENVIEILKTKYLFKSIYFDGIYRKETLEYPVEALREAIFNSIIHRDYNSTSSIQIRIYKNKISFINEGLFPPEVQIEDLNREHLSKPRNILIADIFYKCGFIESWGRGTLKIIKECRNAGLPEPLFSEHHSVITATIFGTEVNIDALINDNAGDIAGDIAGDNAGDNAAINKTSRSILIEMGKNPKITIPELAVILGIHVRNIEKNIALLKDNNFIERVGNPKKGFWKVIK